MGISGPVFLWKGKCNWEFAHFRVHSHLQNMDKRSSSPFPLTCYTQFYAFWRGEGVCVPGFIALEQPAVCSTAVVFAHFLAFFEERPHLRWVFNASFVKHSDISNGVAPQKILVLISPRSFFLVAAVILFLSIFWDSCWMAFSISSTGFFYLISSTFLLDLFPFLHNTHG